MRIEALDDLEEEEFEARQTARPPGYCAQTILRFGGLNVLALLDGGATCSAVPEEVALAIIGHALRMVKEGKYELDSRDYPVIRLQRILMKPRIDGVAFGAPIEIGYAIVLRAEFVPAGAEQGLMKELYFKVLPRGTCSVPGVIIGFPTLDVSPYGLGWIVQPTVHTFSALNVSLPRLELARRNEYTEANRLYYGSTWQSSTGQVDSARLCLDCPVGPLKPVAIVDAGDLCLAPGERAIVPARWDRRVPDSEFW